MNDRTTAVEEEQAGAAEPRLVSVVAPVFNETDVIRESPPARGAALGDTP